MAARPPQTLRKQAAMMAGCLLFASLLPRGLAADSEILTDLTPPPPVVVRETHQDVYAASEAADGSAPKDGGSGSGSGEAEDQATHKSKGLKKSQLPSQHAADSPASKKTLGGRKGTLREKEAEGTPPQVESSDGSIQKSFYRNKDTGENYEVDTD